jgi:hypothetical protein
VGALGHCEDSIARQPECIRSSHRVEVCMAETWWERFGQAVCTLVSMITVDAAPDYNAIGRLTLPPHGLF